MTTAPTITQMTQMAQPSTHPTQPSMISLFGLDPQLYRPHALHDPGREYSETNCYADVLIEFVASCGYPPEAMLGRTLAIDFEGDQWTFFKPGPAELLELYGIDVHEMQIYRPLVEHIVAQLMRGRTIIVDLDAYYLPDTAATSYRRQHLKTSVIVEAIDPIRERLRYFHNGGLFELSGDDFRAALAPAGSANGPLLSPYAELVRLDAGPAVAIDELRVRALRLLREALASRPKRNPFLAFRGWLEGQLDRLAAETTNPDDVEYHGLAFAAVRMPGAAAELASSEVGWLFGDQAASACSELSSIVRHTKTLSFLLARRRPFDLAPIVNEMAAGWDNAAEQIAELTTMIQVTA